MRENIQITQVETFVFRYPLEVPVPTAFGVMNDRPMVLVRVSDRDGATGWGEVWCNFPAHGAAYRAQLIDSYIAPVLCRRSWPKDAAFYDILAQELHLLALQSGEAGPFANAIAGVDMAMVDLQCRRAQLAAKDYFGAPVDAVPIYASGISPNNPVARVEQLLDQGFEAFKLKVGFDPVADIQNINDLRSMLDIGETLAVDANQGWDLAQAQDMMARARDGALAWVEEPLACDRPPAEWRALVADHPQPIALGENLLSAPALIDAVTKLGAQIIQPDAAKWGGFTGCRAVAASIRHLGAEYYPHYLGGGVGLAASAHLLATVNGTVNGAPQSARLGRLEVDTNPNPFRDELVGDALADPAKGYCFSEAHGFGVEPDLAGLASFQTQTTTYLAPAAVHKCEGVS